MKVIPITPRGYCPGVVKAIDIVNKAVADPRIPRPIYILGMIVHNRFVVDDFTAKGVITLSSPGKTRLELLDLIDSGTVIITAHGTEDAVIAKIKAKGLHLINATCKDVQKTHDLIKDYLSEGFDVLFIGKKGHPETEGAMGIGASVRLIETLADIDSLGPLAPKLFVTNQTTLSLKDLDQLLTVLKSKYPQAVISDEICNSTRIRQEALLALNQAVDLCLVIGDPHSNNTQSLAKLSQIETKTDTRLIESLEDLDIGWLKDVETISVTSGASTPTAITNAVIDYLKRFDAADPATWKK